MYSIVPMKLFVRWCSASLMLPFAASRGSRGGRVGGSALQSGAGQHPPVTAWLLPLLCMACTRGKRGQGLTQAKVGDAHVALPIQQHVLRLQVPAGEGQPAGRTILPASAGSNAPPPLRRPT